ncbi:UNVERIFIED_CONTAM: hypothetical protein PYX00_007176 [Menopon gallinae]|uniref:NADH dehydrogenase [ubiquinone] 1 alpha subcomplex assembly factor 2 n=1 Tax=Menopon gallinae TaxID=328185 RepID=A0AAW2HHX7_9NEOP
MVKERSIFRAIVTNFWNSIKPRNPWGVQVGTDYNGTMYFEAELGPGSRRQRPPRWFIPKEKGNFEQDLPAEWEAWLRYRRKDPPTEEEVNANYEKMMLVKHRAAELEAKQSPPMIPKPPETINDFPKYDDLEAFPGSSQRFKEKV